MKDSWALYGIKKAANSFRKSGSGGKPRISLKAANGGFAYKFHHIWLYDDKLDALLHTPAGGLWKYLETQGNLAVAGARAQAGFKTGKLKASIHKRHSKSITGQSLWIGSELNYAYAHHQGTRPHLITPKKGSELVFVGRSRVLVHTRAVHHPGTKPNPYLTNQFHFFDVH